MAIHDWPISERPREKMLHHGPSALSDAELLAVIIGSGTRGRSAVDIARNILEQFGSLRQFLTADRRQCLEQLGIGPVRHVILQAALELARRHHLDPPRTGPTFLSPERANAFLLSQLRDLPYEVFCCLHLNTHRHLIAFEELCRGPIGSANVHVREVARQAMLYGSAAIIFAHNHPSGVPEPTPADIRIAQQLRQGLAPLNVNVLDHMIISDGVCVSMADRGLV